MPEAKRIDAHAAFEFISKSNSIFSHAGYDCFAAGTGGVVDELSYRPGEVIVSPECKDRDFGVGILSAGKAAVYSGDGKRRVLLRYLGCGGIFGVASLFSSAPAPTCIIACDACTVLMLSRGSVRGMLHNDAALLDAYLEFMSDRVLFLNRKIDCVTGGNAERRLAVHLLSLAAPDAGDFADVTTGVNFTALSRQLDIGRASLYRALDSLEAARAISRGDGQTIRIYPERLSAIANPDC